MLYMMRNKKVLFIFFCFFLILQPSPSIAQTIDSNNRKVLSDCTTLYCYIKDLFNGSNVYKFTPQKIWEESHERIVLLEVYNEKEEKISYGSGVVINENGDVLTNLHVISGGYYVRIIHADKKTKTIDSLFQIDSTLDLALLDVGSFNEKYIEVQQKQSQVGDPIVTISSPLGLINTLSVGWISGIRGEQNRQRIQFSAPVDSGSSGGALLDGTGRLVGLISNSQISSANINYAVPSSYINTFLQIKQMKRPIKTLLEGDTK
ncbi:S1C family serine protease [Paenibacillus sp. UNC499MF]|uniref:S1C family serine protease n=1 Tax=Paenibacillus sp. UNC499MF TaxID=1502751 RepID=UPI0008A06D72|nr:S1C family serine protease [Paenibacillus sp. UNC499MF]SEF84072.1 Trypsin-like peptidase domain-containing protein [Paenibacillus sp. UNC499MF]